MAQVKMISEPKDSEEKKQDKAIQDPGRDPGIPGCRNDHAADQPQNSSCWELAWSMFSYVYPGIVII